MPHARDGRRAAAAERADRPELEPLEEVGKVFRFCPRGGGGRPAGRDGGGKGSRAAAGTDRTGGTQRIRTMPP